MISDNVINTANLPVFLRVYTDFCNVKKQIGLMQIGSLNDL